MSLTIPLSGSVDGRGIKIVATAIGSGTTIHTAGVATGDGAGDTVSLFCYNSDTVTRILTLGFGGTTSPDDLFTFTLLTVTLLTIPPLFLRNGLIIKASGDAASKLVIFGYLVRQT